MQLQGFIPAVAAVREERYLFFFVQVLGVKQWWVKGPVEKSLSRCSVEQKFIVEQCEKTEEAGAQPKRFPP